MAEAAISDARRRNMAAIRGTNTKPELVLRRGLHAMGLRYRLHSRSLPGKPDLVFPGRRTVIFVNGCFWHGHACHLFKWPKTRADFWRTKIGGNIVRDQKVRAALAAVGWRVLDVWECALKGRERQPVDDVLQQCVAFLESDVATASIGHPQTVTISDDA
ncbi:very short patch repair endonuclease [Sphingomonas paeninsulae]|uniref:very short patch repair endonuclease n=1 Tax=Sphingomonas paeninsulae TaxID=2319844 RepID=UPI0019692FD5